MNLQIAASRQKFRTGDYHGKFEEPEYAEENENRISVKEEQKPNYREMNPRERSILFLKKDFEKHIQEYISESSKA